MNGRIKSGPFTEVPKHLFLTKIVPKCLAAMTDLHNSVKSQTQEILHFPGFLNFFFGNDISQVDVATKN